MFPGGRDNKPRSYSGRHSVSDKEEIARAALRSLAEPSGGSTSSDPPLLPRPSLPTPSFSAPSLPPPLSSSAGQVRDSTRPFLDDHGRHNDRQGYFDSNSVYPRDPFAGDVALSRGDSPPSFFQDQHMITSPGSSPKAEARSPLPPLSSHLYARHSLPAFPTASRQVHEAALRRASLALGVDVDEVRQIVHHAYVARRTSNPFSVASTSTSSHGHLPQSSVPEHEAVFVRQVLDAYCLESDRASHQAPAHEPRRTHGSRSSFGSYAQHETAALSTSARHDAGQASMHATQPQQHHFQADHGSAVAWGTKSDERLPTFDARGHDSTFRTAYPAHHISQRFEAAATTTRSAAEQRSTSPSPFAYDAYRRTSHPVSQEQSYGTASSGTMRSRASHGYLDDLARSRAIGGERLGAARSRHATLSLSQQQAYVPQDSVYERRVRSIDDYLEQQQRQQHRQRRRGSIVYHPSRISGGVAEYEDEGFPEWHSRSSAMHSSQPYPPTGSRYAPDRVGGGASYAPRSQSPQLSPTMPNSWRFQQASQRRSPRLRSPTAETVTSVASSSVASIATLPPSPLPGTAGNSSNTFTPDERRRSSGAEADAQSLVRGVSEDTAAETTLVGVAKMQIDEASSLLRAPASSRKVRSTRSFSSDRGSAPIAGTDLTHSEIMQRLQDKVKRRLAAKGKAATLAEHGSTIDGESEGKQKNASNVGASCTTRSISVGSSVRAARLARGNSHKRAAASIGKSESPSRSTAASPASSRRSSESSNIATADTSAAARDGNPALKVRRTSAASSQQKTASKPAIPSSKSDTTPASIEAALLSPTDTPAPADVAANRAELLSISPRSPPSAVETAAGQALPGELPGAGQMNASSAAKQQTSMAGIDSLLQAAQTNDPTETNSVIA